MGCGAGVAKSESSQCGFVSTQNNDPTAAKHLEPSAITVAPKAEGRPISRAGAVIFDCDGSLLDTEKLRSEVTFLLLAPYMPSLEDWEGTFQDWKEKYIMKAAGRSFKQKGEDVDEERGQAGLPRIADAWANGLKNAAPQVASAVLHARLALGLPEVPKSGGLQDAKWTEDDIVLKSCSKPCPGMLQVVAALQANGILFNIASTSSQDSLRSSLKAADMDGNFQPFAERVHSGESDFDPPAHKPKPDVYLKAAAALRMHPNVCVAVEDSDSGVGSAANAGMGFIVGYVGGGQIPARMREEAALVLLAGGRSQDKRGADIVISNASGLVPLVSAWMSGSLDLPIAEAPDCGEGVQVWLPNMLTEGEEVIHVPEKRQFSKVALQRQVSCGEKH